MAGNFVQVIQAFLHDLHEYLISNARVESAEILLVKKERNSNSWFIMPWLYKSWWFASDSKRKGDFFQCHHLFSYTLLHDVCDGKK